jgi:DNA-binding response OmpR family regulator
MTDNKLRILLCEEDENLCIMMGEFLKSKNFQVDLFFDTKSCYDAYIENKYSMCILDITLFDKDEFELVDKMHEFNPAVYIIFLTPKALKNINRNNHRNEAYISKPFSIYDLISIIKMKHRLTNKTVNQVKFKKNEVQMNNTNVYEIGKYIFEVQRRQLIFNGQSKKLTGKESDLLTILVENANTIIERSFIIDKIWDYEGEYYSKSRSMDVYICKLRHCLENDPKINIVNIHGLGYNFIAPVNQLT